jgi:hypothetical protein
VIVPAAGHDVVLNCYAVRLTDGVEMAHQHERVWDLVASIRPLSNQP